MSSWKSFFWWNYLQNKTLNGDSKQKLLIWFYYNYLRVRTGFFTFEVFDSSLSFSVDVGFWKIRVRKLYFDLGGVDVGGTRFVGVEEPKATVVVFICVTRVVRVEFVEAKRMKNVETFDFRFGFTWCCTKKCLNSFKRRCFRCFIRLDFPLNRRVNRWIRFAFCSSSFDRHRYVRLNVNFDFTVRIRFSSCSFGFLSLFFNGILKSIFLKRSKRNTNFERTSSSVRRFDRVDVRSSNILIDSSGWIDGFFFISSNSNCKTSNLTLNVFNSCFVFVKSNWSLWFSVCSCRNFSSTLRHFFSASCFR